jgi:hypothetical protein
VPETVESTVVEDPLPPIHFPEFLLFEFMAHGLAGLGNDVVEAFFDRIRLTIELIRSEPGA